eukprot:5209335-Amphidinium_carterae.1
MHQIASYPRERQIKAQIKAQQKLIEFVRFVKFSMCHEECESSDDEESDAEDYAVFEDVTTSPTA